MYDRRMFSFSENANPTYCIAHQSESRLRFLSLWPSFSLCFCLLFLCLCSLLCFFFFFSLRSSLSRRRFRSPPPPAAAGAAKKEAELRFAGALYCATSVSDMSDHDEVDEGMSSSAAALRSGDTSPRSLPDTQFPPAFQPSLPCPFHPPRVSSAASLPCCRARAKRSFMLSYALLSPPAAALVSAFALSTSPAYGSCPMAFCQMPWVLRDADVWTRLCCGMRTRPVDGMAKRVAES
mmetsp:Transcript_27484/g.80570  ORF Transcript_27484/g.80570 Transcript_27484/m.80570 type:complete len:236 (+) Transcript_27484:134-841(+)